MATTAQKAYNTWKGQHKVNLQVKTDEQMFAIGFEEGQKHIDELIQLIVDMDVKNSHLDATVKQLTEELNNAKKV